MDIDEANAIIEGGETQEVEFKQSFPGVEDVAKIICGFANVSGGMFIIGVDNSGRINGIAANTDELQKKVSLAAQEIKSPPTISQAIINIEGKKILFVSVPKPGDNNFHTFKGVIYVRMGSTTQKLEGQSMLEFLRWRQLLCFDEMVSEAKIDDIDKNKVIRFLKLRNQEDYLKAHTIKDFLLGQKLAKETKTFEIKNAALLIFAKDPAFFIPQAELKLVKFSGIEPIEIVTHKVLQGDVVEQIDSAIDFVRQNISKQFKLTPDSPRREDIFEYPPFVIRESIVNAVAHRDYFSRDGIQINLFDDRMEIINPGSIPAGLPREKFGRYAVQRNPLIYKLLRELEYVEGYGTGIARMRNEMRKAGLKDPLFEFSGNFFSVTFLNAKGTMKPVEGFEDLNERQKRAIDYLRQNKTIKSVTYASFNSVSIPTAVNELRELIHFGFVKKIGKFRGAYYILNEEKLK